MSFHNKSLRRFFWSALAGLTLTTGSLQAAETYSLTSRRQVGSLTKVQATLAVSGQLRVPTQTPGKSDTVAVDARGQVEYGEKVVIPLTGAKPVARGVRHYDNAAATIKLGAGQITPKLSGEHRLIAVDVADGRTLLYHPSESLTRDELELIELPANTLILERLLPDRAVGVRDEWAHDNDTLARLLNLAAVSKSEVKSTLQDADDNEARVEFGGLVSGANDGVASEIELRGRYKFDRRAGRISWLALVIREKRGIGHSSPGLDVTAKLQVSIAELASSTELSDEKLQGVSLAPSAAAAQLAHESSAGRFQFLYDRRWHVMSDAPEGVAMRLVDRGELIAQANLIRLEKLPTGDRTSLERFQDDIKTALGKNFGQFERAGEKTTDQNYVIYRVIASGKAEGLPIQWRYYLVSAPDGQRLSAVFTLEEELIEKFAEADKLIVESLRLVEQPPETAAAPARSASKR